MLVEVKRIKKEEVTAVSSLDVAETFGKTHRRVLQDIRELECSKEFNQHNFVQTYYTDKMNRKQPMYYITKDGFTMLVMGYTGKKAMQFKEAYIKQFNAMKEIVDKKAVERKTTIAIRENFTNSIKLSDENERMHGHAYSTYTNLIYKVLFGMNTNQLRNKLGIDGKDNIRDYLSVEELKAVQTMENLVSSLIACGNGYDQIKQFIQTTNTKMMICD